MDVYTQTEICFADTGSTVFTAANSPCPVAASVAAGVTLGTLSYYASRDNYAYGDADVEAAKARDRHGWDTAAASFAASTTFLNPLTPTGTLDFTLPQAVRKRRLRHLQGPDLQDGLELLRIRYPRRCQSRWARAAAVAEFQWQQCHIFVPVFVLSADQRAAPRTARYRSITSPERGDLK